MTQKELSNLIYNRHGGLLKREANEILKLILSILKNEIIKGERIKLSNFGTFEVRHRSGRLGRNPRTGAPVFIPPRRWLRFYPAKSLVKLVNSPEENTLRHSP